MEFDQLNRDLGFLIKMAQASRQRLDEMAGHAAELRDQLEQLIDDAEPPSETEQSQ